MKFRSYILSALTLLLPFLVIAQPSFSTITDESSIHLNGLLQVQYVITNAREIKEFTAPVFRDFKVMHGPIEMNGSTLQNNKLSEYTSLTYILKPSHKGRLVVPGATALINGTLRKSNKVVVEVDDATSGTQPSPYPVTPAFPSYRESPEEDFILLENESAEEKIKKNLLVKLELDKKSAFVGEPIVATYKLYTRLRSESRVSKRPSMNGFSVFDMIEPDGAGPFPENFNGKTFMVHIIRKTQLFPLQEGRFELEPVELDNNIRFLRKNAGNDETTGSSPFEKLFDDLLPESSGKWEEYRMTQSSEPQFVDIKPLPENGPVSFNGAVGHFSLKGALKDSIVIAGENAVYELVIEGTGNLPLINAPQWQLQTGIEQFDPEITENINKMVAPMQGTKKIIYTFTPSEAGSFTLPAIEFSYFDPASSSYHTLRTDSVRLNVKPSLPIKNNPGPAVSAVTKERNNNIMIWVIGLAIFAAAWIIVLLRNKRQHKKPEINPATITSEPVKEVVVDPLEKAKAAAELQNPVAFYRAIELALWKIIADKLQIPGSSQQKPMALKLLRQNGMTDDEILQLDECLGKCEWALYVPAHESRIDMSLLEKANQLIGTIKELK